MTYLNYINLFNRYDRELRFSDGASRLYIKVLDVVNEINRDRPKGAPWIVDFQRSDGYLAGVYGCSINTVKNHRKELVERGLLSGDFGQSGRNSSGKYHLCYPSANMSSVDTITGVNISTLDTIAEDNISNVDTISLLNLSTFDTISPEKPLNVSANVSTLDTLYIEEEKEESSAASAAPTSDFFEGVTKTVILSAPTPSKPASKKPKAKGATHEEIASLPLPFDGAEFAEAWLNFYTTNTRQAGKALTAFQLMLKRLGKMPEGFAVVTLERALMSNWQGIEHGGTPRDLAEWQAEQARRLTPAPAAPESQTSAAPEMNPEFLAQQDAEQAAKRAARLAELTTS
jgi:hypothetical protein